MKKETAVEMIFESFFDMKWEDMQDCQKPVIFLQAKEMEKEQMDKVAGDWWNEGASYMHDGRRKYESFEQYYNETFN